MFSGILFIFAVVIAGLSTVALLTVLRVENQQKSDSNLLDGRLHSIEQRISELLGHISKTTSEKRPMAHPLPQDGEVSVQPPKLSEQPYLRQNAMRKPSPEVGSDFEYVLHSKESQPKPAAKEETKLPVAAIVPPRTLATPGRSAKRPQPYTAPLMPPTLSPLEVRTKEVLGKIWNWIIVGKEYRPKDVSMEYAIATNWLIRIGALILIFGIGFFIQDAIKKSLLGPHARVAMTTTTGFILVAGGSFLLGRKKYHLFGQGLVGIGIVSLYFSIFASMQMFNMITQTPAFILMCLITCLACGIAYRFNTLLIALMGVLGGYATPAILSAGMVNLPGLLTYLTILTAGVLALSYFKDWHLLRAVSLFATWGWTVITLVYLGQDQALNFAVVMPFMVTFFVMFSTMNFLYNFMKRKEATLLELCMIWINAAVFFFVSYGLFEKKFGIDDSLVCCKQFAIVTLGMALFYVAHIYYFLLKKFEDRVLLASFFGITSFMVTITIPILISREWLTVSWAVQAVTILWVAQKLDSRFLEQVAGVLYLIVFCMFFADLGHHFLPVAQAGEDGNFWEGLVQRLLTFGVMIGSFFGGAWLLNCTFPQPDFSGCELA